MPARAEQKPLIAYTAIFVRPTGRPISFALASFPPMAYTLRPKRVCCRRIVPAMIMTMKMMTVISIFVIGLIFYHCPSTR